MRHCLVLFLLCVFVSPCFANRQQELSSIQKKIQANKRQLSPMKKKKKQAQYRLGKIGRDIKYNELKLRHTKQKLNTMVQKEKKAKKTLAGLESEFSQLRQSFEARIVQIHRVSPLGILELVLSPNDWILDAESSYFIKKVMQQDMALFKRLQDNVKKCEQQRSFLRQNTIDILVAKKDIEVKEHQLIKKKKRQKVVIASLSKDINDLLRQNRELESLSKELTDLIFLEGKSGGYYGTGSFIKPVKGWISSRFGNRVHPIFKRKIKHTGIDIAAPKGYKIRAADSGKIIFSGTKGGYGKSVLIYHGKRPKDGKVLSTFYAHQSRIFVKVGDIVKKGDEIGWVGSTGYATGPHLHFEVKLEGVHVDPLKFIPI